VAEYYSAIRWFDHPLFDKGVDGSLICCLYKAKSKYLHMAE
jgi:hypothetical protein